MKHKFVLDNDKIIVVFGIFSRKKKYSFKFYLIQVLP
jgi:hypothetical protein